MNELIKVTYNDEMKPTVLGRDLHDALEIRTAYKDWFPRMCEYGFIDGTDFCSFLSESSGGRPATNHALSIDMAKQICMLQRTELGKKYREYFIDLERKWNTPEAVFARALQLANKQIESLMAQNNVLVEKSAIQSQQIAEMQPKVTYYDVVLNCPDLLPISQISKDYGWSARRMNEWFNEKGVQYKQGSIWLLYQKYADQGYTKSKTHTYADNKGVTHSTLHTYWTQKGRLFIYDLMKNSNHLPLIEQE